MMTTKNYKVAIQQTQLSSIVVVVVVIVDIIVVVVRRVVKGRKRGKGSEKENQKKAK
jgi:UDP-N-acetylmuramyl pentapeptide phosphotransferase/UDP-N-acetylglucosamine-1-phosphate transferase